MLIGIALGLVALFGLVGSWLPTQLDRDHAQAAAYVREIVADEQRAEAAVEVLARMRRALRGAVEQGQAASEGFWKVDRDYGSSRRDYEEAMAQLTQTWQGSAERQLARRVELASHFTEAEWAEFYEAIAEYREAHPLGLR